jgi:hypothetical protein
LSRPDWDLLITAPEELGNYHYFPAIVRDCDNLISLEGLRFRNCYLTNMAIEQGSANLFHALYFNARISGGSVLHVSDYRESE